MKLQENTQDNDQEEILDSVKVDIDDKPNLFVKASSAEIFKDFESFGKMDPYLIVKVNKKEYKTKVHQDAGKHPVWNEEFSLFRGQESHIIAELWENDVTSDDLLGTATIAIDTILQKQDSDDYVNSDIDILDKKQTKIAVVKMGLKAIKMKSSEQKAPNINATQIQQQNESSKQQQIQTLKNSQVTNEELQNKVKEIKDRLEKIQVKLKVEPQQSLIQDKLHKVLLEGLKKIGKERPSNPIRELGLFLINYEENQQNALQQSTQQNPQQLVQSQQPKQQLDPKSQSQIQVQSQSQQQQPNQNLKQTVKK